MADAKQILRNIAALTLLVFFAVPLAATEACSWFVFRNASKTLDGLLKITDRLRGKKSPTNH